MVFTELTHPDDLADDLLQIQRLLVGEMASYKIEKRSVTLAATLADRLREIQAARIKSGKPASFSAVLSEYAQKGLEK